MKKGTQFLLIVAVLLVVVVLGALMGLRKPDARLYRANVVEALSGIDSSAQFERIKQVRSVFLFSSLK